MAGDHADPGHPKPYGCRPHRHTPLPHCRRTPRTPRRTDTERRTLDTWTLRRPHRTPVTWTGPRRTPDARTRHLTPDAGHERGHGDDTTAGIRTLFGRHAERPHAETPTRVVPSHHQAAAWSPRRPGRASAHCCRVLDLDGTSGGQWDNGKVRECGVGLLREC
jgi:hypothetical protein